MVSRRTGGTRWVWRAHARTTVAFDALPSARVPADGVATRTTPPRSLLLTGDDATGARRTHAKGRNRFASFFSSLSRSCPPTAQRDIFPFFPTAAAVRTHTHETFHARRVVVSSPPPPRARPSGVYDTSRHVLSSYLAAAGSQLVAAALVRVEIGQGPAGNTVPERWTNVPFNRFHRVPSETRIR